MTQAIKTLGVMPVDDVAAQAYVAGADVTADVNGIDLGSADYWHVRVKLSLKASGGTMTVALFMSDAANGTGNVFYITPVYTLLTTQVGMFILEGMGNISQRYLNIDFGIGTSCTVDYEVFAGTIATRSS